MERKLLAQRHVEIDPVMDKIVLTFAGSAVTGAGVSWYKDQQSQQEKITHLTIAVEGLHAGMKLQAERTDLPQKSLENLKEEGKKRLDEQDKKLDDQGKKLDDQGKQLDQIFNMLKEKRGRFFR